MMADLVASLFRSADGPCEVGAGMRDDEAVAAVGVAKG